MRYIIELKKNYRTSYSADHLYLKVVDNYWQHVVINKEEATKFEKGTLKKIYKMFGRENIVVHKVKEIIRNGE